MGWAERILQLRDQEVISLEEGKAFMIFLIQNKRYTHHDQQRNRANLERAERSLTS